MSDTFESKGQVSKIEGGDDDQFGSLNSQQFNANDFGLGGGVNSINRNIQSNRPLAQPSDPIDPSLVSQSSPQHEHTGKQNVENSAGSQENSGDNLNRQPSETLKPVDRGKGPTRAPVTEGLKGDNLSDAASNDLETWGEENLLSPRNDSAQNLRRESFSNSSMQTPRPQEQSRLTRAVGNDELRQRVASFSHTNSELGAESLGGINSRHLSNTALPRSRESSLRPELRPESRARQNEQPSQVQAPNVISHMQLSQTQRYFQPNYNAHVGGGRVLYNNRQSMNEPFVSPLTDPQQQYVTFSPTSANSQGQPIGMYGFQRSEQQPYQQPQQTRSYQPQQRYQTGGNYAQQQLHAHQQLGNSQHQGMQFNVAGNGWASGELNSQAQFSNNMNTNPNIPRQGNAHFAYPQQQSVLGSVLYRGHSPAFGNQQHVHANNSGVQYRVPAEQVQRYPVNNYVAQSPNYHNSLGDQQYLIHNIAREQNYQTPMGHYQQQGQSIQRGNDSVSREESLEPLPNDQQEVKPTLGGNVTAYTPEPHSPVDSQQQQGQERLKLESGASQELPQKQTTHKPVSSRQKKVKVKVKAKANTKSSKGGGNRFPWNFEEELEEDAKDKTAVKKTTRTASKSQPKVQRINRTVIERVTRSQNSRSSLGKRSRDDDDEDEEDAEEDHEVEVDEDAENTDEDEELEDIAAPVDDDDDEDYKAPKRAKKRKTSSSQAAGPSKKRKASAASAAAPARKRRTAVRKPMTEAEFQTRGDYSSKTFDLTKYVGKYPISHPNITGTHPKEPKLLTIPHECNDFKGREVERYKFLSTLPPYHGKYQPTPITKTACGNLHENHFPNDRGLPPRVDDENYVDHNCWNKVYAAAAERINKFYTRKVKPPLHREEYTELKKRLRDDGTTRWLAIKLLKDHKTLPTNFYDDPANH